MCVCVCVRHVWLSASMGVRLLVNPSLVTSYSLLSLTFYKPQDVCVCVCDCVC